MYYFAYGSNLDPTRLRDDRGVQFKSRERADLEGFRVAFAKPDPQLPGVAHATLLGDPSAIVQGVLYDVTEFDLEKLDATEGVYAGRYSRATVEVLRGGPDGERVEAHVYIGTPDDLSPKLRPTREYLNHILEGRDLFDPEYYEQLARTPVLGE